LPRRVDRLALALHPALRHLIDLLEQLGLALHPRVATRGHG